MIRLSTFSTDQSPQRAWQQWRDRPNSTALNGCSSITGYTITPASAHLTTIIAPAA